MLETKGLLTVEDLLAYAPFRYEDRSNVKWFHGNYLVDRFLPGRRVSLYRKVELDNYTGDLLIMHPEFEILTADDSDGDASLHTG